MLVEVKRLQNKKWITTTEELADVDQYQGTDTVIKVSDQIMWCGNDRWYDYYLQKGFMVTTTSDLVEVLQMAHSVFFENREERVAIMTTEGLSESDSHQYCDSKPEIYGAKQTLVAQLQRQSKGKGAKSCEEAAKSGEWKVQELW